MGHLVQLVAIWLPPSKHGAEIQPGDAPRCTEVTALAATKGIAGSRAAWGHCRIEGQCLKPVGTGRSAFCGASMAWEKLLITSASNIHPGGVSDLLLQKSKQSLTNKLAQDKYSLPAKSQCLDYDQPPWDVLGPKSWVGDKHMVVFSQQSPVVTRSNAEQS